MGSVHVIIVWVVLLVPVGVTDVVGPVHYLSVGVVARECLHSVVYAGVDDYDGHVSAVDAYVVPYPGPYDHLPRGPVVEGMDLLV